MFRSTTTASPALRASLLASLLALSLVACGGKAESETRRIDAAIARGSNPPGLTVTVCGRVVAYVAPAAEESGRIELDRGVWELVPAAPVAFEVLLSPGRDVCVHASLDTEQKVRGAYVFLPAESGDADVDADPDTGSEVTEGEGDDALEVTSARFAR